MITEYRAWYEGEFHEVTAVGRAGEEGRHIAYFGSKGEISKRVFKEGEFNGKEDVHLQRFTGFHDSQGAKIYEGDILDYTSEEVTVVWDSEYGAWIDKDGDSLYEYADLSTVVGHIHDGD